MRIHSLQRLCTRLHLLCKTEKRVNGVLEKRLLHIIFGSQCMGVSRSCDGKFSGLNQVCQRPTISNEQVDRALVRERVNKRVLARVGYCREVACGSGGKSSGSGLRPDFKAAPGSGAGLRIT